MLYNNRSRKKNLLKESLLIMRLMNEPHHALEIDSISTAFS